MDQTELVYSKLKLLANISREEFALIEDKLQILKIGSGENLFSEGEVYTKAVFLLKGLLKKYYLTLEGKEFIKEFGIEGDIVAPYSSLLQGQKTIFSVQALENSELLTIEWRYIKDRFDDSINWMRLGKVIAEGHFISRELREMELLKYSAKERLNSFRTANPSLFKRLKKQDVASYLGITPVSLSRLLSE